MNSTELILQVIDVAIIDGVRIACGSPCHMRIQKIRRSLRRSRERKGKKNKISKADREINEACRKLNEPFNKALFDGAKKFDAAILAERKYKNKRDRAKS